MKSPKKTIPILAFLACCLALSVPMAASAQEVDGSIAACLKVWGDHPFGKTPKFKTLDMSVSVFGLGTKARDSETTSTPALVLVKPVFNLMGTSTVELLTPNGWYCLQTTVSLVGGLSIRAHCKAQLAATSDDKAVLGNKGDNREIKNLGVTVMSSIAIERPCD